MAVFRVRLVLLLCHICTLFFGTLVVGYPHENSGNIQLRNALVHKDVPVLTTTVIPCPLEGCGLAARTSFQQDICQSVSANLSETDAKTYAVTCEVDYPQQDILPYLNVGSFDSCMSECSKQNDRSAIPCAGFVFIPDREQDKDDCYLKYALDNAVSATEHAVGATTIQQSILTATATISSTMKTDGSTESTKFMQPTNGGPSGTTSVFLSSPALPTVASVKYLGASVNKPVDKYVSHPMALPMKLAASLLTPGINMKLINNYPMASDTGVYSSQSMVLQPNIQTMKSVPKLTRDGGKGGMINGTHVVYFCDTLVTSDTQGVLSFVSSSVTTDLSVNDPNDTALQLVDELGEWQDDVGRMRGFIPMTQGEEAFNNAMSGNGYRYAVWPESSPIVINSTHALIYAVLQYDSVDMSTQEYNLTSLGNTILVIEVDPVYGVYGSRITGQLFQQDEITYGSLGGYRAWGLIGPGAQDGDIFLFGKVPAGVFLARTTPTTYLDRTSYKYWDGTEWSSNIPAEDTSNALILKQPVQDFDIIYAPAYHMFLMIYMTTNADNTFYYRYCQRDQNVPPYQTNGNTSYAEAIHNCAWSDEILLYRCPEPERDFAYAGGVHSGYYGERDMTANGSMTLLTWTSKIGASADSTDAGYAHNAVRIDWAAHVAYSCNSATICN